MSLGEPKNYKMMFEKRKVKKLKIKYSQMCINTAYDTSAEINISLYYIQLCLRIMNIDNNVFGFSL